VKERATAFWIGEGDVPWAKICEAAESKGASNTI